MLAVLLALSTFSATAQYTNGIYSEFNTSMGSFTCRLNQALAPKAVANFIGLATGERAWLDSTGRIRRVPFYDGTTFHRVIAGFMNQGGSPDGSPSGGPGYQFTDETNGTHDAFGTLSMANAGPDSNGSQFFITAGPQPSLNGSYSVFGRLFGGSNVVYAINRVATDGQDKPLTNIVLHSVRIHRIGAEAQAFDIHAQGLPLVTNIAVQIARAGTNVAVTFSNRLGVENYFYGSTNLQAWAGGSLGLQTTLPVVSSLTFKPQLAREFFRMLQVQYPGPLYVPRVPNGKVIKLNFNGGLEVTMTFDQQGNATYTDNGGGSGGVVYSWKQDPYRGRFNPLLLSGYNFIMTLHLDFDSPNAGTFNGSAFLVAPIGPVSGTFTCNP